MSLSKTEWRSIPTDVAVPFGIGADISKYDLIKNVFDAMISKHDDIADHVIPLIEEVEEIILWFNLRACDH